MKNVPDFDYYLSKYKSLAELGAAFGSDIEEDSIIAEDQDYKKISKKKEHERQEGIRDTIHKMCIFVMWGYLIVLAIMTAIWLMHLVVPASCPAHYLSYDQLNVMQNFIFSGTISALLVSNIKRYI